MSILNFKSNLNSKTYLTVSVLGSTLKLNIKYLDIPAINLDKTDIEINLSLPKKYKNMDNMEIINLAIQKLYNKIAETEIEYAMENARYILNFAPNDYSIKRLENEFYRVYKNTIIINPDIVRFNREVINTTVLQAFCKTKYKSNSIAYKKLLNEALNKYEICKIKNYPSSRILKVS